MVVCTRWKARPLSPEQANRMMLAWGKLEASLAANPSVERIGWYIFSDGSGGITLEKYLDADAAIAAELETLLALGEFFEFETRTVLDLETAMPAILKSLEHINS